MKISGVAKVSVTVLIFICALSINASTTALRAQSLALSAGEQLQATPALQQLSFERNASSYSDFATAVKTQRNAPVLLIIDAPQTINENLIVPQNITLRFAGGNMLIVNPNATLIHLGGIEAGLQQIFGGQGRVRFLQNGKVNKRIEQYFPQWFGVRGDGETDDAPAVQRAIDFVPDGASLKFTAGLNMSLGSQILIQARKLLTLEGGFIEETSYIDGTTPKFVWRGGSAVGGAMMFINNSRGIRVRGLGFLAKSGANEADYGIKIDQTLDSQAVGITTGLDLRDLYISFDGRRKAFVGISIGEVSNQNQENITITNAYILPSNFSAFTLGAGEYGATGTALRITSVNAKTIRVRDCVFMRGRYGVYLDGGSVHVTACLMSSNGTDFALFNSTEPSIVEFNNSEHARQGAIIGQGNAPYTIRNSRFGGLFSNANNSGVPYIDVRGPEARLMFESNVFERNPRINNLVGVQGGDASLVAINNDFGSTTLNPATFNRGATIINSGVQNDSRGLTTNYIAQWKAPIISVTEDGKKQHLISAQGGEFTLSGVLIDKDATGATFGGNVTINGALAVKTKVVTGARYDINASDNVIYVDANANAVTVALPDFGLFRYWNAVPTWTIKKIDNSKNAVKVISLGAAIDGKAEHLLSAPQQFVIIAPLVRESAVTFAIIGGN